MSVFVYSRISPKPAGKADSSDSLEVQHAACLDYCQRNKMAVIASYCDPDVSARQLDLRERPGGAQLLAQLNKGDSIVVFKLDRIFRDVCDGLTTMKLWGQLGITLHASTGSAFNIGTPEGWLALAIQLVFAEYEPMQTAFRTSAAIRHKMRNGESIGKPPYGWRKEQGRLVENSYEGLCLRKMLKWEAENTPFTTIAELLNIEGYRARSGSPFQGQVIAKILRRAAKRT